MKIKFPLHETALNYERIAVSAGMRGVQVILEPKALADYVGAVFTDLKERREG